MPEHIFDDRAGVQLATVQSINDSGQAQTATVKTTDGGIYADVEVIQAFGLAARPPADGALALLLAIGGDPANMRAILFHPSWRLGGLADREAVLFGAGGARVAVRADGSIEVGSGSRVTIKAPDATIEATGTLEITAASMVVVGSGGTALTIQGDVTVQGDVSVQGIITSTGSIHAGGGYH